MPNHQYLIVGGGMAADAAVAGIRQVDPEGSIGLISAESHPPYDRPPLSKGLWKGRALESIWRKSAAGEAALYLGRRVQTLDPTRNLVRDEQGTTYHYQKLLLATGGTPRRLPADSDAVLYFRTLDDYQSLRLLAQEKQRFAVVGGGFIGSEIAAALAMNGKQVVMVFPEAGIGGRMFPPDLSRFLNDFYRQKGIEVRGRGGAGSRRAFGPVRPENPFRPRPAGAGDRGGCRGGRARHPAQRRVGAASAS